MSTNTKNYVEITIIIVGVFLLGVGFVNQSSTPAIFGIALFIVGVSILIFRERKQKATDSQSTHEVKREQANFKICPSCKERMQTNAITCENCGFQFRVSYVLRVYKVEDDQSASLLADKLAQKMNKEPGLIKLKLKEGLSFKYSSKEHLERNKSLFEKFGCTVRVSEIVSESSRWDEMVALVENSIIGGGGYKSVKDELLKIANEDAIQASALKNILIEGWEKAAEEFLSDEVLSTTELQNLSNYELPDEYKISQTELDRKGYHTKLIKSLILDDILKGKKPNRINIEGTIPFNLQKDEVLIWIFNNASYFETITKTHYEGGSIGGSVRIAKGFYLRSSSFRGYPVKTKETVQTDVGMLGITDKHIYFLGSQTGFRVKFSKIVYVKPFSDGIGIIKDTASAKPQAFVTDDGWFTYNLVSNLVTAFK